MADVEDDLGQPLRGVVEVEWDGWEDEGRRSRLAVAVAVVLLVATVVVVALVVRAVGTEAELPPERPQATEGEASS